MAITAASQGIGLAAHADAGDAASVAGDVGDVADQEAGALRDRMGGQRLDVGAGVRDAAVVAELHAEADGGSPDGVVGADGVGSSRRSQRKPLALRTDQPKASPS